MRDFAKQSCWDLDALSPDELVMIWNAALGDMHCFSIEDNDPHMLRDIFAEADPADVVDQMLNIRPEDPFIQMDYFGWWRSLDVARLKDEALDFSGTKLGGDPWTDDDFARFAKLAEVALRRKAA